MADADRPDSAPGSTPNHAPAPAPTPERRPRPEYGEYAPEGWEWKPEGDERPSVELGGSTNTPGPNAPAPERQQQPQQPAGAPAASANPELGQIPGVPHNLGVGTALPHKTARAAHQGDGSPYRGTPPQQAPRQSPQQQNHAAQVGPNAATGSTPARPRQADRIITIVLLAMGAIGSLQFAGFMYSVGTTFSAVFAESLGIDDVTVPTWLPIAGKITSIAILALFAFMLIYSIRRIRAGKLTFWVPLVAGVVVFVAVTVIMTAAMFASPEVIEAAMDPTSAAKMLESLQQGQ